MAKAALAEAYTAFGLTIRSDFPLPELPLAVVPALNGDAVILEADLSARWQAIPKLSPTLGVSGNEVMFIVKDTAIYSVKDGNVISVSPASGADPDAVRLFILGSCMGILLIQKRILPLHGSALAIDGKAYALVGASGAGKSTLASYFMDQGYSMLSDDVIPVIVREGQPFAVPGYPQQKLWQQSLDYLGMNSSHYRPLFQRETKFAVPVQGRFHGDPLPLAGIFELSVLREGAPAVTRVSGLERLHLLFGHTYQRAMINRLGVREWHFGMLASFVNRLPVYRLSRPEQGYSAPQLASYINEAIEQQAKERAE
ncbi:hypothetical protein [Paenibacillus sp. NFR01]|uniref:hypothetical protein n=1 Tax=Paenibacillus sp. NFR01 TaxID=1566279 RepID=UPI0008D2EF59|nr:hypothetical protein [Paenibacillus sp. NFR01]SEU28401.1 hypothetical protein SAMN03159358_4702 [Paenibacillus sp. NFR01]